MTIPVLFIATSSNANPGGGRTRIVDVALESRKRGFSPLILCFFYGSQTLIGFRALSQARESLQADAASPVFYVPFLPFTRLAWVDWLNNWFCGLVIAQFCLCFNIRAIYGHGGKAGYLGLFARALRSNIRVISDIQGAVVDEYLYSRASDVPDAVAHRLMREQTQTLVQSDRLIFVSSAMQAHYKHFLGHPLPQAVVIPCATRSEFEINLHQRKIIRRARGLDGRLVVCYAGSAHAYQRPDQMVALFKSIIKSFPQAFFLIFSYDSAGFKRVLDEQSVPETYYQIDFVPHSQIFEQLQSADVGLLLRDDSLVNRVASPTKFAEYLLCGLPVLTTAFVGDYSDLVKEFSLGCIVDPSRLETADDGLIAFLADVQSNQVDYAQRCARFAREHFTWERYSPFFDDLFVAHL